MRLLLTTLTLLMWTVSYSQVPSKVGITHLEETNIQRYEKDYELKNFTLTASNQAILYQLDLNAVEHNREPIADVEVTEHVARHRLEGVSGVAVLAEIFGGRILRTRLELLAGLLS